MPTVKIEDIRRVPTAEAGRLGKDDVLVMYELDPMHRYIVKMKEEDFNDENMKKAIQDDMRKRKEIVGKQIEIPE